MQTVCRHMAIKRMSMTKFEREIRQPKCMMRSQHCEIIASRFVSDMRLCALNISPDSKSMCQTLWRFTTVTLVV